MQLFFAFVLFVDLPVFTYSIFGFYILHFFRHIGIFFYNLNISKF